MAVDWKSLSHPRSTAIALGNFDGVHLGHRRLLKELRDEANRLALDPLVLTFEPHPRHFLSPENKAPLLTPWREKEALIRDCGVEVITLSFDAEMAGLSAGDFISEVLIQRLHGTSFFLGPGHHFGHRAQGDANLLRSISGESGSRKVREIPSVSDETGEIISSSTIRRHLEAGQVETANRMLGKPFCLRGEVIRGAERGRLLGFPTANLRMDTGKALPAHGVYGGAVRLENREIVAVGNVGLRPTFQGDVSPSVEVHLIGQEKNLYGQELAFEVRSYLRPEMAFDSKEALCRQISADVFAWKSAFFSRKAD